MSFLKISNLKFSWVPGGKDVLNIEAFEVASGERVFLYGPSGSGKSTLLNLIGGVLTPSAGSIEFLDRDLVGLSSAERDEVRGDHMGFIFQSFNLLPYFSAIENVVIPCEFSKLKKKKVLDSSKTIIEEAQRLIEELHLNVNDIKSKNVTQLSVGQQQRVATARALMGKPELIIADEPTSALDANIRDRFIKLLFEECQQFGSSILFVSHDMSLGKHFDRVVSLEEINSARTTNLTDEDF